MRSLSWLLSIVALVGCSESPALIVDLRTDYRPGIDFGAVRTELVGASAPVMVSVFESDDFTTGRRVAELEGLEAGTYEVRVTLLSSSDASPFAETSERVEVDGQTAVTVEIVRAIDADGGVDGGVDGAMDGGVDPCLESYPRRPPTTLDGDDGVERVFVFVDWELFPPSPNYGFNLDGQCTQSESTASCTGEITVTDEAGGVDNAWASRISGTAAGFFDMFGNEPQADLWALQNKGIVDLLIRVRGWNGLDDDRAVEVDLMQTVCGHLDSESDCTPGMVRPAGLTFDGTDAFYVSDASIDPVDPTQARVVQTSAYVSDGMLVVPIPDESALRLPVDAGFVDLDLRDATLIAPITSEAGDTIENAMITGRWSQANLRETIALWATCPNDLIFGFIDTAITGALDIMGQPTQDNMSLDCDAVSVAFRMTGYPGVYGGSKPQVRLPLGCP